MVVSDHYWSQIIHLTAWHNKFVFELDTKRSLIQVFKDYPQAVYVGKCVFFIFNAMYVLSRYLLQVKILVQSSGLEKGGGPQTDILKKDARRRPQHVCPRRLGCVCPWTLCVCVWCESFSPAGGALMANWKVVYCHSTPYYLVSSGEGPCVFWCPFFPLRTHTYTQIHTVNTSTSLFWHMPASYLAQPLHYPPPCHALSRKTPAVKVVALPASILCCIKVSLCCWDTNTLLCFLIICLHQTKSIFIERTDSLALNVLSVLPTGDFAINSNCLQKVYMFFTFEISGLSHGQVTNGATTIILFPTVNVGVAGCVMLQSEHCQSTLTPFNTWLLDF